MFINFTFLLYSFLFVIVFIYLGFGLTLLICPKKLNKYVLFLAPLVGYCFITLVSWFFCTYFKGTDEYYVLIFLLSTFFLVIFSIISRKKLVPREINIDKFKSKIATDVFYPKGKDVVQNSNVEHKGRWLYQFSNYWTDIIKLQSFSFLKTRRSISLKELVNKELLGPVIVAAISFLVLSFVSIKEPLLTSVSLGNNDIALYSTESRILKEMSLNKLIGYSKQEERLTREIKEGYFGSYLVAAFFSSVFHLETYQTQNIITYLFFVFSIFLLYTILRNIFKYTHGTSVCIIALYSISPIMFYTIYHTFLSEIIGINIFLGIVIISHLVVESKSLLESFSLLPISILLVWGLSVTYSVMLFLAFGPLAVYVVLLCLLKKSSKLFLKWSSFWFFTFIIVFSISIPRTIASIQHYFILNGGVFGWNIPCISLETLFGLNGNNLYLVNPNPFYVRVAMSVSLLGSVLIGYVFLLGEAKNFGSNQLGGYKHYKLLSFFYH